MHPFDRSEGEDRLNVADTGNISLSFASKDEAGHKFVTFTIITLQKTGPPDSPRETNDGAGTGGGGGAAGGGDDSKATKKEDKN